MIVVQDGVTMNKKIIYAAALILFFAIAGGAGAAMVDTSTTGIEHPSGMHEAVCSHFKYMQSIFCLEHDGSDLESDTAPRASLMYDFATGSAPGRPESAFLNLPVGVSPGLVGGDSRDITIGCFLPGWYNMKENGRPNVNIWRLFDDFPMNTSTLVADSQVTGPATPLPASVLMLSSVLIGMIGFRRTVEP